jgi:TonB family protein
MNNLANKVSLGIVWNFSSKQLSNPSMNKLSPKLKIIVFGLLLCSPCLAQNKSKTPESELFAEVAKYERITAECEQKRREYQISQFGKVLPKISGHCWDGCPTNIVLPYYPREAKRLNISGQVRVETIVDENGKVIYAKVVQGNPFLSRVALQAAYLSTYTPKKSCDDKSIKFRWTITYNFR